VNINYLTYLLTSNTYKIESKLFIYLVRVICFSCIGYTWVDVSGVVPELWLRRADLSEEYSAGEEDNADEEKEYEQAELTHAGADRLSENL